MEMGDQYSLPDLRQLIAGRTYFPAIPQVAEQFSGQQNLTTRQHSEMMMVGHQAGEVSPRGVVEFCGLEMEGGIGGDGGNGRWPRQETLTLLEIRSRLDPKFKEANQKGPLWDEVSRIMAVEHGFQRSGKKCREKFENLYKYYKKTKEGKGSRQDGKHYRFFRQLEALYGETSNPLSVSENNLRFQTTTNTDMKAQKFSESLSLSNSSDFNTSSSSEDNNNNNYLTAIAFMEKDSMEKKKMKDGEGLKRGRKSWKSKIRDMVDSQMKKLMEMQEAWFERLLKTLEHKEQERMSREAEWRKQEAAWLDREHKYWANERASVKARDAALMEALQKFTGRKLNDLSPDENENGYETLDSTVNTNSWPESEISSLIQLRTSMEPRFEPSGCSKGGLWEEISVKMACLGYDLSAKKCKETWENVKYLRKNNECNKKRKENSRTCLDSIYNQEGDFCGHDIDNHQGPPDMVGLQTNENCFRFLMSEGENLWENYGVKTNKGEK